MTTSRDEALKLARMHVSGEAYGRLVAGDAYVLARALIESEARLSWMLTTTTIADLDERTGLLTDIHYAGIDGEEIDPIARIDAALRREEVRDG